MEDTSELLILKLGGSVITEKAAGESGGILHNVLIKIGRELAESKKRVIIVHGAGSYGHPQAAKYHIQQGVTTKNREGIYAVHKAVCKLNTAVVSALRDSGIEAISVHPFHGMCAKNGVLYEYPSSSLKEMCALGLVPVLHGDVVMDLERGACIVSGDQLIQVFSQVLHVSRVGILTNVPGVLAADGSVIPHISRESLDELYRSGMIFGSAGVDVTGGMQGKIEELLVLSDAGICSTLFSLDQLPAFLRNEPHEGTVIYPTYSK
ncbi:MAG: isopentenyl phosphate kinase family protein [Methanomicrobiales archaeon]|jgi:isopentenyl phosphate kinase|nr:isopentenyl phosphate kinase family protein [Methanomicrobiales archaeon]